MFRGHQLVQEERHYSPWSPPRPWVLSFQWWEGGRSLKAIHDHTCENGLPVVPQVERLEGDHATSHLNEQLWCPKSNVAQRSHVRRYVQRASPGTGFEHAPYFRLHDLADGLIVLDYVP